MELPDGSILMHDGLPYDPVKAHEYYIKYRKLHPRAPATGKSTDGKDTKGKPSTFTVKTPDGKAVKLSAQQLEEQKVYAAARVAAVQKKMTALNDELKKRVAAAKVAADKADAAPTAADKAKAAAASKKFADSHKQELANKAKTAAAKAPASTHDAPAPKTIGNESFADLKSDITKTKASLTAAVAKQKELAGATKNG